MTTPLSPNSLRRYAEWWVQTPWVTDNGWSERARVHMYSTYPAMYQKIIPNEDRAILCLLEAEFLVSEAT